MSWNALFAVTLACSVAANAEWTSPVEVHYDEKRCMSYRASLRGDFLVLEAGVDPGWHTFAMDNKRRQQEKLAGKPSLGIERSTEIAVSDGLEVVGPWLQSTPKDFSKPEIRWFSWGFDKQGTFAAKVRRTGPGPAKITVRGQACSDAICKNIDVSISLPLAGSKDPGPAAAELKALVPVR